ncbi:transcriptional regulator, TetR family [Albimonas donghaensis]|uniref:Transcriptional regulator, TetR family n=1 Tax=Albimonas donghaensis TaxID=356660 RepID=A0A1H3FC03_9RHOB|nr:TetR/AcrR family transcriptional regulator [Albimonas donghaensis]MAS44256.1 TetR family transcriptional regulator [Paracoccaceae bacterium]MBR26643.1 TetR family transcriptional regulator [Paracoccaceae bacterium]SDX88450.1 transcriptional regulator, TetR family [Albimonas donghaensis]
MAAGGLREKHKKRRLKQVLDAADRLFTKHGYEATRIETIADSASVAPATVYNYFSTKPNLLMELALRHVKAALPERRAYLRDLPDDIFAGVLGFERLLAEQAMRHLSRESWRVILSAQHLEPGGKASRTGARLNNLIKRHYMRLLRTYQARGVLRADVDVMALSNLIVGITTQDFSRFVASQSGTIEDLLATGVPHVRLILTGLLTEEAAA